MLKLNPLVVAFELVDFSVVRVHCIFDTIRLFVDLFNDDLGIAESQ
jgi:hypothetical protein